MTVLLVTRHPGALAWARGRGLAFVHLPRLDPALVRPGDAVVGNLPQHLAAAVGARGGRFLALELDLPEAARGRELDAAAMTRHGARLVAYRVERLGEVPASALAGEAGAA